MRADRPFQMQSLNSRNESLRMPNWIRMGRKRKLDTTSPELSICSGDGKSGSFCPATPAFCVNLFRPITTQLGGSSDSRTFPVWSWLAIGMERDWSEDAPQRGPRFTRKEHISFWYQCCQFKPIPPPQRLGPGLELGLELKRVQKLHSQVSPRRLLS
jgi:hypothetical protein